MEIFFRGGDGVGVILFIPRTVLKHKIQLPPAKFALFRTYQKKGQLTPTPECDLTQNYLTNHNEWKICKKMST